jgi:hypothetical protein
LPDFGKTAIVRVDKGALKKAPKNLKITFAIDGSTAAMVSRGSTGRIS